MFIRTTCLNEAGGQARSCMNWSTGAPLGEGVLVKFFIVMSIITSGNPYITA